MKYSLILMLVFVSTLSAAPERVIELQKEVFEIKDELSELNLSADCLLKKYVNVGFGYMTGQAPNDMIVTYFDPATCATPGYPFSIHSFSFTFTTIPDADINWPISMDVVIFSSTVSGDNCSEPDTELYRYSVNCDSASWTIPSIGTAHFPDSICIDEPFFIGVQYSGSFSYSVDYPSLLFDTASAPTACDNFYYFDVNPAEWYEWYDFWGSNIPGYPWFEVNGSSTASECIADSDNDGISDSTDNCPLISNPLQTDTDFDLVGDSCDNCPEVSNLSQLDSDSDGLGNLCDDCPDDNLNDIDNDSICESIDNCPGIYNPLQEDIDSNGRGDACENCCNDIRGNVDNDSSEIIDISDLVFLVAYMFGTPIGHTPPCIEEADIDASNEIDISDLVTLVSYMFGSPPGAAPANCP